MTGALKSYDLIKSRYERLVKELEGAQASVTWAEETTGEIHPVVVTPPKTPPVVLAPVIEPEPEPEPAMDAVTAAKLASIQKRKAQVASEIDWTKHAIDSRQSVRSRGLWLRSRLTPHAVTVE
jgi:hypothetical protein